MELTRKELYDLVWAEPMTTICKRFGISDNGLRKHCKSMNIPTPPAGYWAKIKFGKKVKVIPLPEDKKAKKQSTELHEVDPAKLQESPRIPEISRNKVRELEIRTGDLSVFAVPEVLYAKDPVIIDTKEKFRRDAENTYLKKSPYKSKIGPTLNIYVSEKSLDRALSIFSTIIKALRFRGHDVKISDEKTYAVINNEKIHVSITERKKRDPNSENPRNNYYNIYSGELHFNVYDDYRIIYSYKDTTVTKLEDKIVPIIADLEIRSEEIKEERIKAEKRRIQREKEEQERQNFFFTNLELLDKFFHTICLVNTGQGYVYRCGTTNPNLIIRDFFYNNLPYLLAFIRIWIPFIFFFCRCFLTHGRLS